MAEGGSPFVMVFASLDSQGVATLLNFVILTAAVSVYNGTSYWQPYAFRSCPTR